MLRFFTAARKPTEILVETAPPSEAAIDAAPAVQMNQDLGEALDLFEKDVLRIAKSLSREIGVAKSQSGSAANQLEVVKASIDNLVEYSQDVDQQVSAIASSTDELAVAANEISGTVDQVRQQSATAMERATQSARDITSLGDSVQEIGGLLSSIGEIATRTNLLALNATIEAARAGDAGRGFAVVAQEVKALSVAAAQSVAAIRSRMDQLQAASANAIEGMNHIRTDLADLAPVCASIADTANEQRTTLADLAMRMSQARESMAGVANAVRDVNTLTDSARMISREASSAGDIAAVEVDGLGRRVVTILRSMEAADRRKHERFPIDLAIRVKTSSDTLAMRSFDVSEGGILIRAQDGISLSPGISYEAELSKIGTVRLRAVGSSPLGIHCAFDDLPVAAHGKLLAEIEHFHTAHRPLVERSLAMAEEIQRAIENEMKLGSLSLSTVFDTDYVPVPGSDPVQFTTRYLPRFDIILPQLLEKYLGMDPNMVFCLAIDRNGYIPVHNKKVSLPQKPGERIWNMANCRNRRFFDDRTGLLAGRLMRPSLIQTYNRDMGGGNIVQMKEVDARLMIGGRHWGGIRMAYRL